MQQQQQHLLDDKDYIMLLVLTKNKIYVTFIWNKHEHFRKKITISEFSSI